MLDDTMLTISQTVDALKAMDYPATVSLVRWAIGRGNIPVTHDRTVRWIDAKNWAAERKRWRVISYQPAKPSEEEETMLHQQCVYDMIILYIKSNNPSLDKIFLHGDARRREILNQIVRRAIAHAEYEMIMLADSLK